MDTTGNQRSTATRQALARERTLAIALVRRADTSKYGTLITDLENEYAMGKDKYPHDLTAAKSLLVHYKTPINSPEPSSHHATPKRPEPLPPAIATTFAQNTNVTAGKDSVKHNTVQCYNCQQHGHFASE